MTAGAAIVASRRSRPPQSEHAKTSSAKTRRSRAAIREGARLPAPNVAAVANPSRGRQCVGHAHPGRRDRRRFFRVSALIPDVTADGFTINQFRIRAEVAHGATGVMVSLNDLADRCPVITTVAPRADSVRRAAPHARHPADRATAPNQPCPSDPGTLPNGPGVGGRSAWRRRRRVGRDGAGHRALMAAAGWRRRPTHAIEPYAPRCPRDGAPEMP